MTSTFETFIKNSILKLIDLPKKVQTKYNKERYFKKNFAVLHVEDKLS